MMYDSWMMMKTRTIVEDVSGTMSQAYFAEVEVIEELDMRRQGTTVADAARLAVSAIRQFADDAERKFVKSGALPPPAKSPDLPTFTREAVHAMVKLAYQEPGGTRGRIWEAVSLLDDIASGHARIA